MYSLHKVVKELASKSVSVGKRAFVELAKALFPLINSAWTSQIEVVVKTL